MKRFYFVKSREQFFITPSMGAVKVFDHEGIANHVGICFAWFNILITIIIWVRREYK